MSKTKKRKSTDRMKFARLRTQFQKLGFREVSPNEVIALMVGGITPPDVPRMEETFDAPAFKRKFKNLWIYVYPTFNSTITERNGKKVNGSYSHGGAVWIRIIRKDGHNTVKLLTRKMYRSTNMSKNIIARLRAILVSIEHQPKTKDGQPWVLTRNKAKETFWVNPDDSRMKLEFFREGAMPDDLVKKNRELEYRWSYYRRMNERAAKGKYEPHRKLWKRPKYSRAA